MFRRKTRSKPSFLVLNSSNRGSDIAPPNNTSLIVNESDTETDNFPKELTSVFSEDEDDNLGYTRRSSSLMKSLSQKKHSTPLSQSLSQNTVLKGKENPRSQIRKSTVSRPVKVSSPAKENSYFEEVLKAGGAVPLEGNSSFLLSEDQAVFAIRVNNKLKESPENVKKFVGILKEKIQDSEYLNKMLAHTLTSNDCEAARGPVQDPLIRMLLNVECLQADLVELLLDTIAEFIIENKAESENVQSVSSILYQMRCLSGMKDLKIASKLFEIIQIATVNVKREIIFLLPEIISEEETEETCIQLIDLLKFDEMLTQVIVDALTNLPLNKALRSQVCAKVLHRLDKCPVEFLPTLIQFVLNKCDTEELNQIINGLRNNLPFTQQHYQMKTAQTRSEKNSEEDSYVKLTFENLKYSVMASKEMTEAWIKVISNLNSPTDFRCIDLMVLIIFYGSLFGRKNQILQLIRNKIKMSVLVPSHVQNMFKILVVVAEEYCSSVLELASALLKSFELKISNFGALMYKECFMHFHFYAKKIVISEILMHVGTGTPATVNTALRALRELCDDQKEGLNQHTVSIMGLLVKVPDLDLTQVRLLMDIIADLVFCESADTSGQDELLIFIRKQLMSSKADQYKKGVAAAVMFGKHCGKEDDDDKFTQINSLFELAMGSDGASETKTGFFNDELATMVKDSRLSKSFLEIWSKKTSAIVMDKLFVKDIELECEDFPMSLQYSLQIDDVPKFVFPVVQFVLKTNDRSPVNVPVVPSCLRLFCCLEENLNKTLPALYAAVIMPEATVYDDYKTHDESQRKKIMDCLFLCANYLIECVNALCDRGLLDKARLRVKQLIEVRKLIARFINEVPEYSPPLCQFYASPQKIVKKKQPPEKKPKRGRKRKLEETAADASTSLVETQQTQATAPPCTADDGSLHVQEADLTVYSCFFRELDFSTHKLLAADLKSSPPEDSFSFKPELETCDVLFLLQDFLQKSERILKSAEVPFTLKGKQVMTPKMTPEEFIEGAVDLLPGLLSKIETFARYTEDLLQTNDWVHDSRGLFVQGASDVKLALAAGLKFIAEIVSWQGFQNSKHSKDFLTILSRKDNSDEVALDAANYLSTFSENVLVLTGALSIVKAFQACLRYSGNKSNSLADLCHKFLCRSWFTVAGAPDRGAVYNQHVDFLLRSYFSSVDNKLEVVRNTAKTALGEVGGLTGKDSVMKTFKTINKNNFPLLYRTMCESLVTASTSEFSNAGTNSEKQLDVWNKIVETLLVLVETAKTHPSRVILASLLKRSQSVIQLFLSKGIPLVESALRVKSVEVLTLLKSFQMVTRFLHSICCQSRITNDSVVAAHVPAIRSQCEKLTLEVKGMLILNGIPMDCITIAILKNRDIKGNDIISQESLDDNSDDDSELPPEDTPDVEENLNVDTQESYSESY